LHQIAGNAVETIQPGLQIVGCKFPELCLRHLIGSEAVAQDRKAGEIEAVCVNGRGRRQRALNAGDGRVDHEQRLLHVHAPIERQIDFRGAAAGGGAHILKAGNAVERFFQRTGDGDFHLIDRHHAVIDADDDAREIRRGENGNGDGESFVNAGRRQHQHQKNNGFRVPGEPIVGAVLAGPHRRWWRKHNRRLDLSVHPGLVFREPKGE
jgi:hypothetical protein